MVYALLGGYVDATARISTEMEVKWEFVVFC
ncbi:hypothetical protein C7972_107199 [Arenibacter sp. ARW7G5Y1]|nr:hypothetical protein C7972_107199 [Arenibacter sp. ARW7G5Y1]